MIEAGLLVHNRLLFRKHTSVELFLSLYSKFTDTIMYYNMSWLCTCWRETASHHFCHNSGLNQATLSRRIAVSCVPKANTYHHILDANHWHRLCEISPIIVVQKQHYSGQWSSQIHWRRYCEAKNSRHQVAPYEETVGAARQKVGSRSEYHIRLGTVLYIIHLYNTSIVNLESLNREYEHSQGENSYCML